MTWWVAYTQIVNHNYSSIIKYSSAVDLGAVVPLLTMCIEYREVAINHVLRLFSIFKYSTVSGDKGATPPDLKVKYLLL